MGLGTRRGPAEPGSSVDRAPRQGLHVKARSAHPAYPARAEVADADVSWQCSAEYHPIEFTHPAVFANDVTLKPGGWADPGAARPHPTHPTAPPTLALAAALTQPSPNLLAMPARPNTVDRAADPGDPAIDWSSRESFEGGIRFAAGGSAPTNPRGRTGMHGRGLLGKWGPNHAADPIVTRFDPSRPDQLQVVAIKRKDTGDWALPGGMVDSGETVSLTVKREFEEEAGNLSIYPEQQALFKNPNPNPDPNPNSSPNPTPVLTLTPTLTLARAPALALALALARTQALFKASLDALFDRGKEIYSGYVDDPRNTDNAWMETTAFHFHCSDAVARRLPLRAGDDASDPNPNPFPFPNLITLTRRRRRRRHVAGRRPRQP